ncbi:histidine phosphatase family protein [Curvibacter sp. APW13]|uniref:histidine phosphatase family protein n=1 Tax=Curvibacter sp. APW13 TaxID=3077236 RepID=UPI0028DE52BD|nr:histidine phosphatase family protein [Curvibacter sp. APW13]MDT8991761.1 histidine phosphatase family protein [Curvibacter sp. APW13]
MKLWLLRHARPLVDSGVCYGALDVAADAQATLEAAQQAATALPADLLVWYSPLQRCERLAHVLQGLRPDLTMQSEPRLREMDFGSWEGVRWGAIGLEAMDAWTQDFGNYRCGGAESANAMLARVGQALEDFGRQLAALQCDQGLWITHAGVARCVQLWTKGLRQLESAAQWPKDALAWGALHQVHVHE